MSQCLTFRCLILLGVLLLTIDDSVSVFAAELFCTQLYTQSYKQFLQVEPVGLGLVSFCMCAFFFFLSQGKLF